LLQNNYHSTNRITSAQNISVVQNITDDIGVEEFSKELIEGLQHLTVFWYCAFQHNLLL